MSEATRITLVDDVAQLVDDSNRFAFDLYSKLAACAEGDLFFSPSSITLALAMTYAGAAGQTLQEMADVLHFSLPQGRLHEAFRTLQANTRTGGVEFRIANRLWGQLGYHYRSEFLQMTERCYGAKLTEMDFQRAAEAARQQINTWVEDQTVQKIKNLIPAGALGDMTRLVLTNAIYFLGSWESEFDEADTMPAPFWESQGNSRVVPMMRQRGYFSYAEDESCQFLELPYRQQQFEFCHSDEGTIEISEISSGGSDFAMCIILPKSLEGLNEVEARLSSTFMQNCASLRSTRVEVHLPRFGIESMCLLEDVLTQMGMRQAFSAEDANFLQMSDNPEGLYVGSVIHKAFVEVNEKGTEAAAATGIVMAAGCIMDEPEPKLVRVDHPFLFLIRDRQTGLIHFIGRVVTP